MFCVCLCFLWIRRPPRSTRPDTLFPYTTRFRSGAGHLKGLARHLREDTEAPAAIVERLQALPEKSSIPWFTIALTLFVLGGFAWGFWHGGADVGTDLVLYWVLWTGGLGALGCAVAGGQDRKSTRLNSSH